MRTPTRSPTPCASPSRPCANASANPGSSPPWPASAIASTRNQIPLVQTVHRARGLSVRLKLTLSYAGFLMIAGASLLAAVWVFLLRYVPDYANIHPGSFVPNLFDLRAFGPRSFGPRAFGPAAAAVLAFLLV